jgi:aspartyl-tRNA(Asn)/glutamyl-tRNA(Gln) amidotransferase subunit C
MSLDKATVARIAALCRIKIAEGELEALAAELDNILTWVAALDTVDTEGVPPMTGVTEMALRRREDAVDDGDCAEQALANAPETDAGYFTVPKVLE